MKLWTNDSDRGGQTECIAMLPRTAELSSATIAQPAGDHAAAIAPIHGQHQADWAGEVRGRRTRGLSESCAFWELPSSGTRHSVKPEGFGTEEVC